jgi:hypothetical protein
MVCDLFEVCHCNMIDQREGCGWNDIKVTPILGLREEYHVVGVCI